MGCSPCRKRAEEFEKRMKEALLNKDSAPPVPIQPKSPPPQPTYKTSKPEWIFNKNAIAKPQSSTNNQGKTARQIRVENRNEKIRKRTEATKAYQEALKNKNSTK